MPAARAVSAAGSTPRTARTCPSRPSSPEQHPAGAGRRPARRPAPPSTAAASARSKPLPRLGSHAGDSAKVIRRCGHGCPLLTTAARTRSRASASAASGRPMTVSPGRPCARSASTSTTCPSSADEPDGVRPRHRHHSAPRRCCSCGAEPRRRTMLTTSKRRSAAAGRPVLDQPPAGQRPQLAGLAVADRLGRLAEAGARAGLHLAEHHRAVGVAQHEVELALRRTASCVPAPSCRRRSGAPPPAARRSARAPPSVTRPCRRGCPRAGTRRRGPGVHAGACGRRLTRRWGRPR